MELYSCMRKQLRYSTKRVMFYLKTCLHVKVTMEIGSDYSDVDLKHRMVTGVPSQ